MIVCYRKGQDKCIRTMTNDERKMEGGAVGPAENSSSTADEKGHTFRKRRLSLTNLRQLAETKIESENGAAKESNDHKSGDEALGYEKHLPSAPSNQSESFKKEQGQQGQGHQRDEVFMRSMKVVPLKNIKNKAWVIVS